MTDLEKLRGFANRIMQSHPYGDVDGAELQEAAVEFELLEPVMATEPCGEGCNCAECGDFPQTCYRRTALLAGGNAK